jgi:hypothetical protein
MACVQTAESFGPEVPQMPVTRKAGRGAIELVRVILTAL